MQAMKRNPFQRAGRQLRRNWQLYVLLIPVIAYFIIFKYWPMYGVQISFRQFMAAKGIWGSPWVGFKNFERFFSSYYFERLIRNTLSVSIFSLLFSFPMPILLALMINELRGTRYKKTIQMVTYAPHFLSITVVVGMLNLICATQTGLINQLRVKLGYETIPFLTAPQYFLPLYIISDVWQQTGWNAVIYIAAIAGVDYSLYEAAYLDGADTLKRIWHVTLPCIAPTIVIMLILKMGSMMNVGFEKVWLMQNALNREASDVISTYTYRAGLLDADYSYSAAVGLFNSVINFVMLVTVNKISRKVSEVSLW